MSGLDMIGIAQVKHRATLPGIDKVMIDMGFYHVQPSLIPGE
jgi:hypothetical protein